MIDMSTEKETGSVLFRGTSPHLGLGYGMNAVYRGRSLSGVVVGMSSTKQSDVFCRQGGGSLCRQYYYEQGTEIKRLILFWGSTQGRGSMVVAKVWDEGGRPHNSNPVRLRG